jgi:hypothetical protein
MSITTQVVDASKDAEFAIKTRLNFTTIAHQVIDGTWLNITPTDAQKDIITRYAYDCVTGRANVNAQVDAMLSNSTIQSAITAGTSYDSDLAYVAWTRLPALAGVLPVYVVVTPEE